MPKEDLSELAHPEYWDERYKKPEEQDRYDWLRGFNAVKPFLLKHLPDERRGEPRILHVGCGNSTLPIDLHNLGFTNQTSIDFSQTCTDLMKSKHPSLDFRLMDCRAMTFEDGSFEYVIDKATLDAMLYGSLWDPEPEVRENVGKYVDEVVRTLKDGGIWLYITWRQPHFVRPLILREGVWDIEVETVGGEGGDGGVFEYYGFVCRKRSRDS